MPRYGARRFCQQTITIPGSYYTDKMRALPRKGMRKVTTIPAHRDNEGMKAGALDNRRDRAFIQKKEEKGEENHGK